MGKVSGKLIGSVDGITITASRHPAKTDKGKDRLWIQIRQNTTKKWKVYTSLSYARSVDVQFVAEPE